MCVCVCGCVQTVYELPLLPNKTAMKNIYTNRSGAKCRLNIYHWGAGLSVTGRMHDIGQNVSQSAFETGSNISAMLLEYFVTYRFLQGRLY